MATTPVHVFARWKVKEGSMPEVLQLLQALRAQTLSEAGNLFYSIHKSSTDDNTLILFEGYTSASAQEDHVHAAHFKTLAIDGIVPLLSEREVFLTTPLEY